MKRRTTVGLNTYINTSDASKGATLFATTGKNYVADKAVLSAHIVNTQTDLDLEFARVAASGDYVYDARTNEVWKYTTSWAKDTSGTFTLSTGRLYSNPLTLKMFFVESAGKVNMLTLGVKDAMAPTPTPDFWAPLSTSLALTTGRAPYDQVSIGSDYAELNSRSLNFSRLSTATYIDKSGYLRSAEINEPRFEKNGLLLEGQSTNLALYSSDLTNAVWTTAYSTKSAQLAPDGSNGAVKFIPSTVSNTHTLIQNFSATAGKTYTWSVFVKAGELTKCVVQIGNFGNQSNPQAVRVDLVAKTAVGTVDQSRVTITELADGWLRVSSTASLPANPPSTALLLGVISCDSNWSLTMAGDGTSGFYVWGGQMEELPIPSSYIPTTGASATRTRDVASVSLDNWGPTVGTPFTVALELDRSWDVPTNDAPRILRVFTDGAAIELTMAWGGVVGLRGSVSSSVATLPLPKGLNTIGMRHSGGYTSVFLGKNISTSTTQTAGTEIPIEITIGEMRTMASATTRPIFAHVRNFRIWNRALTDEQIKGLS